MIDCLGDFSQEEAAVAEVWLALFYEIEKIAMMRVLLSQKIKLTLFAG